MTYMWSPSVVFIFGIILTRTGVNGIKQESEEKNSNEPVLQLNHNWNKTPHNDLHKRQINLQFQSFEPQYQSPFLSSSNGNGPFNQFPAQQPPDEEERFFSSGENPANTLNPLAFFSLQTTTTNPIQQQLANEQRRFQQEIADKGLREQEELSLGLPRLPQTTQNSIVVFRSNPQFSQPTDESQSTDNFNADQNYPPELDSSQSYSNFRIYRSNNRKRRAIEHPVFSSNNVGNILSSTVNPETYLGSLLQHPTPKSDIAKIGNWLVNKLTMQLERNIAHLTGSIHKSYRSLTTKPQPYGTKYVDSSELPLNSVTAHYPEPTQNAENPNAALPWNIEEQSSTKGPETGAKDDFLNIPHFSQQFPNENLQQKPNTQNEPYQFQIIPNLHPELNLKTIPVQYFHTETAPKIEVPHIPYVVQQTPSTIDEYPKPVKIKNIQILPTESIDQNLFSIRPYDNRIYDIYKQIYDVDHQTIRPTESVTSTTVLPIFQSTLTPTTEKVEGNTGITSLFKTKLREFKRAEPGQLTSNELHIHSDFQHPDRFLEQLQQPNATTGSTVVGNYSTVATSLGYNDNSSKTAIFIKIPEETPTSTVGFLFDKTISAKTLHKKENPILKKNSGSAQIIKSSLVYRTPPGKRATVSRQELHKNNEAILSTFLESEKPAKWLFGQTNRSTTSRPFVTALWNLIQKRSPLV